MADAATTQRFHAERQALALMDHPDIAQVYEADTSEYGQPYFAMEYCKGVAIDEYCDQQCLDLNQRVALVIRIARRPACSRPGRHSPRPETVECDG